MTYVGWRYAGSASSDGDDTRGDVMRRRSRDTASALCSGYAGKHWKSEGNMSRLEERRSTGMA